MFQLPPGAIATTSRHGPGLWLGEFVATFGLLAVIWGCLRLRGTAVAGAVGAYIAAAIWFTSSAGFANPAVTAARALTDTFTGIAPADVLPFMAAQLAGAAVATFLFRWLLPTLPTIADEAVLPHHGDSAHP